MKRSRSRKTRLLASVVVVLFVVGAASYLVLAGTLLATDTSSSSRTTSTETSSSSRTTSSSSSASVSTQATSSSSISIIGADRPPGYVMGNLVDGGLRPGMTWLDVGGAGFQAAVRFTSPVSGPAAKVSVHGFLLKGNITIEAGLQQDSDGSPSGTWLGGSSNYGSAVVKNTTGFITFNLPSPVSLSTGAVYELVVSAANGSQGTFAMTAYPGNNLFQPMNPNDPDINWPDKAMNSLESVNGTWAVQNKYPVFAVGLNDGKSFGQPYSLAAPWVIFQDTYVGQTIIPASNYKVGSISFVVSKEGSPTDDLYYAIYDSSNNVVVSGKFASAQDVPTFLWTWRTVNTTSVSLEAGHLYRIVLFSPKTDLHNCYQLIGLEYSFSYGITYGASQQRLTLSRNAGASWSPWLDADCMFKLVTVP